MSDDAQTRGMWSQSAAQRGQTSLSGPGRHQHCVDSMSMINDDEPFLIDYLNTPDSSTEKN